MDSFPAFFPPAMVDRGQVVAAVGTGGASPVLAQELRKALERAVPEGAGRVAEMLQRHREETRRLFPDMTARRAFVAGVLDGPAAAAALAGDMDAAERLLRSALDEAATG